MTDARYIRCPHCTRSNRVDAPGLHTCGHCGSDFYARRDEATIAVHNRRRVIAHIAGIAATAIVIATIEIQWFPITIRAYTSADAWTGVGLLAAVAIMWSIAIYRGAWGYDGKQVSTIKGDAESKWLLASLFFVQVVLLTGGIDLFWHGING